MHKEASILFYNGPACTQIQRPAIGLGTFGLGFFATTINDETGPTGGCLDTCRASPLPTSPDTVVHVFQLLKLWFTAGPTLCVDVP